MLKSKVLEKILCQLVKYFGYYCLEYCHLEYYFDFVRDLNRYDGHFVHHQRLDELVRKTRLIFRDEFLKKRYDSKELREHLYFLKTSRMEKVILCKKK